MSISKEKNQDYKGCIVYIHSCWENSSVLCNYHIHKDCEIYSDNSTMQGSNKDFFFFIKSQQFMREAPGYIYFETYTEVG